MKTIKVDFCSFWSGFDKKHNTIIYILKEKYDVIIDEEKPDYLFYSSFNKDFLKYDCIKIYYTGECIVPDFNLCDYAIAFEELNFGDRYLRVPLYKMFSYRPTYETLLNHTVEKSEKTDFCGFVVSNDRGSKMRFRMFELLSKYKKVDSGGRYMNNVGGPVRDKLEFDRRHKFSICFENCSHIGYTTEKIMEAFAADTIPIYWGNPDIGKEFNTKAFVNVHEYPSLEAVVERIIEIDNHKELYDSMKREPIVKDADPYLDSLRAFLYKIFDQDKEDARRRPYTSGISDIEFEIKVFDCYHKLIGKHINKIKAAIRRYRNNAL